MEIAKMTGVTKLFGKPGSETVALRNVDFAIHAGELVLLLGPSGSGKTTFLTILAGFQKPTTGQVYLFGKDLCDYSPSVLQKLRACNIGFIFQTFNLISSLNVSENIMLVTRYAGIDKPEASRLINGLLNRFEIGHLKASNPATLSQGEKQRVAVIRALISGAELIIADEPTGSLSTKQGNEIVAILRECVDRENRAVIMVSHDERLKAFANRTLYLHDGNLQIN